MFSRDSYTQGVVGAGLGAAARQPLPSVVAPTPPPPGEGTAPITSVLKGKRVFPPPELAADGARQDRDGYFRVLGRVDDVLTVAGHCLNTTEIESALDHHDKVAEAAVVGRSDEIKGEGIARLVTLKRGITPPKVLKKELREHLVK
jgi:acyl-CoA synthetase (AMP-forming)/AMP-acid ligase II